MNIILAANSVFCLVVVFAGSGFRWSFMCSLLPATALSSMFRGVIVFSFFLSRWIFFVVPLASKQVSKRDSKQASKRDSKQASKQASRQAGRQASKQASK